MDVVEDYPLALCDARTASLDDLVGVSSIDKGYIRHNFIAKYNPGYRFSFLGDMRNNEMCIFKVFDSKDGVAQSTYFPFHSSCYLSTHWPLSRFVGVLHSSFKSRFASPSSKPRESIEVRLVVVSALEV